MRRALSSEQHLLPVALRVRTDPLGRVQLEPPDQLLPVMSGIASAAVSSSRPAIAVKRILGVEAGRGVRQVTLCDRL
jgi:hypothetical protein